MRKTYIYFIAAAMMAITFASCEKDNGLTEKRITFEDVPLGNAGYQNKFPKGLILSDVLFMNQSVDTLGFAYWYGFAVSKNIDTISKNADTLPVSLNDQYSVYGTGGAGGSKQFAVAYQSTFEGDVPTFLQVVSGKEVRFESLKINNTAYTALTIKNGNDFSKKFEDGDWFKIIITGYNVMGAQTGAVEFYLADFRNNQTTICHDWQTVNLLSLGKVNRLDFRFESSDTGIWGINTPTYACIDDIVYLSE